MESKKVVARTVAVLLSVACLTILQAHACTIFVLTDAEKTLFFNNEDWSNPSTRIWFEPGGEDYYGAAYVGFDNGWSQGGVNTEGLAFDWVAGYQEDWQRDISLKSVRGNPSQRMLETCSTVDEAISFFKNYWEPGFSYAKMMIADKSGKSVIIGAKNGELIFDISNESRGFGYGAKELDRRLMDQPSPSVSQGVPILQACMQEGEYATKYSSIYDLRSGQISIISFVGNRQEVQLSLFDELNRGAHFYELSRAALQKEEQPVALEQSMKRFPADEFKMIEDTHPEVTEKIAGVLKDAVEKGLQSEDFEEKFWQSIEPAKDGIRQDIADLGKLLSITPVASGQGNKNREFLYRIEYEYAIVVQRFGLDEQNRIALIIPEVAEAKMR